ncbi:hypothetical protein ABEB36_013723 [Hypothenemus hampei]|uniref:HAT C-terminal dimerisation domain-containing protein n=1 Tax=Hypothenemus hampei TaxID=57062 RepID=A0ABD1E526_HYPHA
MGIDSSYHDQLLNVFKERVYLENPGCFELDVSNTMEEEEDSFFVFGELPSNESILSKNKIELEIQQYFNDNSRDLASLDRYPAVRKVFIKYNTPLPSSAPVERLFSYATMTNLPKSNKISDYLFEKRVLLKSNMHLLH